MIKAWKFSFQPSHEHLHGDPSLPTRTRSLEFSWTDAVPPKDNRALDVLQRLSYSEYLQISTALNYALVHDARFYPSFLRTDHLPRPHRSESELLSGLTSSPHYVELSWEAGNWVMKMPCSLCCRVWIYWRNLA